MCVHMSGDLPYNGAQLGPFTLRIPFTDAQAGYYQAGCLPMYTFSASFTEEGGLSKT